MKHFIESEENVILIRISEIHGSAPRNEGTFMLVNKGASFGTIGGGILEYDATKKARKMISQKGFLMSQSRYNLGPILGQCCGGGVELSFEWVTPKLKKKLLKDEKYRNDLLDCVRIFGAGHVGQALINQLAFLPLNVSIIDSRPQKSLDFLLPANCKTTAFPEAEIRNAGPQTAYVILTHDHALDFLLVKEALLRADAAYIGMIGSRTKKAVLKSWLEKEAVSGFEKVFTPLGASLTKTKLWDKQPQVIASLIIAEIVIAFQLHKSDLVAARSKGILSK